MPQITAGAFGTFNPVQPFGSYAPANTPALDDLFDFFELEPQHGFF